MSLTSDESAWNESTSSTSSPPDLSLTGDDVHPEGIWNGDVTLTEVIWNGNETPTEVGAEVVVNVVSGGQLRHHVTGGDSE